MKVEQWLDTDLGRDIWNNKYRHKEETFDEWLIRVSGGNENVAKLIEEKKFMFGGRATTNRGTGNKASYSNCYSHGFMPDDLDGIMELNKNLAMTFKSQGGQGVSLSNIRPKGTLVGNGSFTSDGIIPFMEICNTTTSSVSQGGSRKGALMMSLSCEHKEIMDFITIKSNEGKIEKANLSVEISDEFMESVECYYDSEEEVEITYVKTYNGHLVEYSLKPIEVYKAMMQQAYDWAEPGVIYTKQFREHNLMQFIEAYEIVTGNPCFHGDTIIETVDGRKKIKDITKPVKVYSMDKDGKLVIKQASASWMTKKNAETLTIEFNNGKSITVTSNHKIYIKNKGWIEAKDLKVNDIPIALLREYRDVLKTSLRIKSIVNGGSHDVYDITVEDTHCLIANEIVAHNCGEQPLPEHGACCLGSINLSEFVKEEIFLMDEFLSAVTIAVKGLNEVLDEGLNLHALQQQKDMATNYRNIGLGIMGVGDMFIKMGLTYGSRESIEALDRIMRQMFRQSVIASRGLAIAHGSFPKYEEAVYDSDIIKEHFDRGEIRWLKEGGLRNCSLLSIAPTGSIGTMLDITTGIEPAFAWSYRRKTESLHEGEDVYYTVFAGVARDYMEKHNTDTLPDRFVSSGDIDWKDRIDIQSVAQKHVDTAISSTVNLPNEASIDEIEQLYLYAWKQDLKGITIFRDGCKRGAILTTKDSEDTEIDIQDLPWGTTIAPSDGMIGRKKSIMSGCGRIHCQAWFDPIDGRCMEVFLAKGSSGGCNSFMLGLSRMTSLALRTGANFDAIIDQLNSTPTCPSYSVRSATKRDTSKGNCCPTALGNALKEMQVDIFNELEISDDEVYETPKMEIKVTHKNIQKNSENNSPKCPECGEPLRFEGGCNSCMSCGFTRCE